MNQGIIGILKTLVTLDPTGFAAGARTASTAATGFTGTLGKLKIQVADVADGLIDVSGILTSTGQNISDFGKRWTLGVSLPMAGAGIVALKFASDFQQATTRLSTLSDVAIEQVESMRASILALGPAVGIGPKALSEALLAITSTGIRGAEALDILENAAKASAIGLGDARTIAAALTSVMNAYGKENITAAQATDILVQSVVEGKAEASEFAPTLGRVIGLAAQMGVSFAQTGAFVATFTRLGVDADEAVTALRGTLSNLLSASPQVEKALDKVNLSAAGLRKAIREEGLADTLLDLVGRFRALGEEEALADVIPNVRALAGVLGTAGAQGDAFREVLSNIENSMGVTGRKFDETTKTMSFGLAQLRARIEAIAISFGTQLAPAFNVILSAAKPILDVIASAIRAFAALPQPIQTVALAMIGLTVAIGPLLIAMGSLVRTIAVLGTLSTINALLGLFTGAVTSSAVASTGFAGILAVVTGWFTRIATPVMNVVKQFLTFGNAMRFLGSLVSGSIQLFVRLGSLLTYLIPQGWAARIGLFLLSFQSVRNVLGDVISIVTSLVRIMVNTLGAAFDFVVQKIRGQIAELVRLHDQFRQLFPGLATLEDAMVAGAGKIHTAAVALKEYADNAAEVEDVAGQIAANLEAASRLSPAAQISKRYWEDFAKGGIKPALDASEMLAMQLGETAQILNDPVANALAKVTSDLRRAEEKARDLSETQKSFLTVAIREGTMSLEQMATRAETTVGAVEHFKKKLQEATAEADKATQAFKQLRDQLGGQELLTDAKRYEAVLKAVGGAAKLTQDEQAEVVKAFDAVIAKYMVLGGPVGAAIVAHFTALRQQIPLASTRLDIWQRQLQSGAVNTSELVRTMSTLPGTVREGGEAILDSSTNMDAFTLAMDKNAVASTQWLDKGKASQEKALERWRQTREEFIEMWKGVGQQVEGSLFGGLGTLFFGQLGHDITGELKAAADEAELDFLRLQRSGRATAKELTIAFERWREAEDRANFSFGERFAQLWGGIKQTVVRVLDDILGHFVENFLKGMLRAIGAAKLGEAVAGSLLGAATGATLGGGAAALAGGGSTAAMLGLGGAVSATAVPTSVIGTGLAGGAAGGGFGATIAGLATNPFTIAAAGGLILGLGIAKKGWFRGGEEAMKVNPRRDKFQLQFGSASDSVAMAGMKLAALLSRLTGTGGGGPLFRAMQMADSVKEWEAAQSAIVRALTQHGHRGVRMFNLGGIVPPGVVQPAILHGGSRGEIVAPLDRFLNPVELHQHYTVAFTANTLDAENMDQVFANRLLPRLHREFELNQRLTLTRLKKAMGTTP